MTSLPAESETTEEPGTEPEATKPPLNLDVEIRSPSACQRHVIVTVAAEDVERYFSEAVGELVPKANVPGFRAGRAPRKLVESHFRRDLRQQIKGSLLLESINQVTEEKKLSAISEPDFDIEAIELPESGPFRFEFGIEVRPEFELPEWKGLAIDRPTREVSSEDVDRELRELSFIPSTFESVNRPVQLGDFISAELVFSHEGREIARYVAEQICVRPNLSLADGIITGFDKLVTGMQVGEEQEHTFELSEEAEVEAMRGEPVTLVLRLQRVEEKVFREVDIASLVALGFDSLGELRDAVKARILNRVHYEQARRVREQITAQLAESASWELPPNLLRRQSEREMERAVMELRRNGFSEDEIRTRRNHLRQNSERATANALKEHFVLEKIAESQKIDATEEDFDSEILLIAQQSNESPRSVRARIEKGGLYDVLRNQIVERKVIELIKSHAIFRDVPFREKVPQTTAIDFSVSRIDMAAIPEAKYPDEAKPLGPTIDRD